MKVRIFSSFLFQKLTVLGSIFQRGVQDKQFENVYMEHLQVSRL